MAMSHKRPPAFTDCQTKVLSSFQKGEKTVKAASPAFCILAASFLVILLVQICALSTSFTVSGMAGISWEVHPYAPRAGEMVTFDTTSSGIWANETFGTQIYYYSWEFGDGVTANGSVVTHTYSAPGKYTLIMATTTDKGEWGSTEVSLTIGERTPLMVYVSLGEERVFTGQETSINGNLTLDENGQGLSDEIIQLSYNNAREENWTDIASVKTDSSGNFTSTWRPSYFGAYEIKATWVGNSTFPQTSDTAILSTIPLGDLITGFTSNSTVTAMNFNLTTQTLTFTAGGPDGTIGCTNITLKNVLGFNPQNIAVMMDNQIIPYSVLPLDENSWLLIISYTHSTHDVTVALDGNIIIPEQDYTPLPSPYPTDTGIAISNPTQNPTYTPPETASPSPSPSPTSNSQSGFLGTSLPVEYEYAIVAVLVIVVVIGLALVYFKKHRKQT